MKAVDELRGGIGVVRACSTLGVARSTYRRHRRPRVVARRRTAVHSHRRLDEQTRAEVLELAFSERFVDVAPAAIVATLLDDESRYLCSTRSMYRILADEDVSRDRRDQRRHPVRQVPELVASRSNSVWTWDITRLPTFRRCQALFLYLVLDIYSRFAVGWMVADREAADLARRLLRVTAKRQGIRPGSLTLHADRGAPMTSKSLANLLADLEIKRSFSRPRTSDDNPFVESAFKTIKYHPRWPGSFANQAEAEAWASTFFDAYNRQHRHSGLLGLTPATVHAGLAEDALKRRHTAISAAYEAHPQRFVAGPPKLQRLPDKVWINDPERRPNAAGALLISTAQPGQSR
jgi:putative transposase